MSEGKGRKAAWWAIVLLGWLVAGYAMANAFLGEPMFPPELKPSFLERPWAIAAHAFFGAIAMVLGPWQFRRDPGWNRVRHRWLGRVYLGACLLTGLAGLVLAPYSYAGPITHWGFGLLAVGLVVTSSIGFASIRARQVAIHREWMIRSYALILAGVTLRLQLPILTATLGDFATAYRIIAWICWVPNAILAEWYLLLTRTSARPTLPTVADAV